MCFRLNTCKLNVLIQKKVTEDINLTLPYKAKAFLKIHFNIYMLRYAMLSHFSRVRLCVTP